MFPELNSVEVKRIIGVLATDRAVLLEYVDAMLPDDWSGSYYLCVDLADCGNKRTYLTREDISAESVPCECGADYEHWFIKYKTDAPSL